MGGEVTCVGDGPFVTVVSVDGGSLSGNRLTVKTSSTSGSTSCSVSPLDPTPPSEDELDEGLGGGGGAYVTVLALGKEKIQRAGEKTSVVNILNDVEEVFHREYADYGLLTNGILIPAPRHSITPSEEVKKRSIVSIEDVEEEVMMYRLPGERLGLGLRFELINPDCETSNTEMVGRIFIESCAEGSPANRCYGSWGGLSCGDEILAIGGVPIGTKTRQYWIHTLRDAPVALSLRVRHLVTHSEQKEIISSPYLFDNYGDNYSISAKTEDIIEDNEIQEEMIRHWDDEEVAHLSDSGQDSGAEEETLNWDDVMEEVIEPSTKPPVVRLRSISARDSLRCYKNQRPLSLHLDPPCGYDDFGLIQYEKKRAMSLENFDVCIRGIPNSASRYGLGRSVSVLGQDEHRPYLEPPPSFQDRSRDDERVYKSRSLVNITHDDEVDVNGIEPKVDAPIQFNQPYQEEEEEEDGCEELGKEFVLESEEDEEVDELHAEGENELIKSSLNQQPNTYESILTSTTTTTAAPSSLQRTNQDEDEVRIQIEWLHEIQEEESNSTSPTCPISVPEIIEVNSCHLHHCHSPISIAGGDKNWDRNSVIDNSINTRSSTISISSNHDTKRLKNDKWNSIGIVSESVVLRLEAIQDPLPITTTGKNLMNELVILRPLPLATILLDKDLTILPIPDRNSKTGNSVLEWTKEEVKSIGSNGMDSTIEFQFSMSPSGGLTTRLPPDGHESPNSLNNNWAEENYAPPPLPTSLPPDEDPPPLPASGPPTNQHLTRNNHYSNKINSISIDSSVGHVMESSPSPPMEPSIRSVRDKIALFSSVSEDTMDYSNRKESYLPSSGANLKLTSSSYSNNNNNNYAVSTFPNHRSSVSDFNSGHNHSFPGLLEERRKSSFSRLRGLVLSNDKSGDSSPNSALLDLPQIRSKDAPLITATIPKIQPRREEISNSVEPSVVENTNQWRVPLPKYSPAFKRRTLAPYVPPKPSPPPRVIDLEPVKHLEPQIILPSPTCILFSKEDKNESDRDSAFASGPGSLPHEVSLSPSTSPILSDEEITDDKIETPYTSSHQSPLQAIFDMEVQMAYINEICDALTPERVSKRRDSEVTVVERPIRGSSEDRDTRSPSKEKQNSTPVLKDDQTYPSLPSPKSHGWSPTRSITCRSNSQQNLGEKVVPKVGGTLERKIERIIEKTSTDGISKSKTTSIPRGRNDFKSLAEKWQQISTQTKTSQATVLAPPPIPEVKIKELPAQRRQRTISVNDIRRAFEKAEDVVDGYGREEGKGSPPELLSPPSAHFRVSSFDSTTSEESNTPGSNSLLSSIPRDPYGSITSLASSTSLISPQELQQLIEEANQSLEEAGTPSHEVAVVILHREFPSGSLGITLAGGADYETKEITVHKVLTGSIADRDGRIYRGDRVLSINGKNTKGLTHREALNLLKAPRTEVVLVVSRGRTSGNSSFSTIDETMVCLDRAVEPLLNGTLGAFELVTEEENQGTWGATRTVILIKDGAGLGFSLDGGKGSIHGDKPLTIKKIFVGGPAEKSRGLGVGDLIVAINETKMNSKSRTEAWNFMKKLGDGEVRVSVRKPLLSPPNSVQ